MNEYCEYKTIDQIKYKINKWINKLNRYRMNFILNDLFFFFFAYRNIILMMMMMMVLFFKRFVCVINFLVKQNIDNDNQRIENFFEILNNFVVVVFFYPVKINNEKIKNKIPQKCNEEKLTFRQRSLMIDGLHASLLMLTITDSRKKNNQIILETKIGHKYLESSTTKITIIDFFLFKFFQCK